MLFCKEVKETSLETDLKCVIYFLVYLPIHGIRTNKIPLKLLPSLLYSFLT